jgi:hypothetical protein
MYSFLVLGIIPGTNIQISFQAWLVMLALSPFAGLALKPRLLHMLEWGVAAQSHSPLHASQLHHRIQPTAR